jgi:transcriptional regulator with XRE-family HTH domain
MQDAPPAPIVFSWSPAPWTGTVGGIGARIRELRLAHSPPLSQSALARLAGVDRSYVARIEAGRRRNVSLGVIRSLADALGVQVADIAEVGTLVTFPDDTSFAYWLHRAVTIRDPRVRRLLIGVIREFMPAEP